jgi:hypothetical protein
VALGLALGGTFAGVEAALILTIRVRRCNPTFECLVGSYLANVQS